MHSYPNRQSSRLQQYDYSGIGLYFITIVTAFRIYRFGEIENGKMVLSDAGLQVVKCMYDIPKHFPHAHLDCSVIMPNHVHWILQIHQNVGAKNFSPANIPSDRQNSGEPPSGQFLSGECYSPLQFERPRGTSKTVGSIVRGFKTGVTKWFRLKRNYEQIWQRNYHDHIIRDEISYTRISDYIKRNPELWESDCMNVKRNELHESRATYGEQWTSLL